MPNWKEEFDEKFTYKTITMGTRLKVTSTAEIKSFIQSTLTAERERVVEIVQGIKTAIGEYDEREIVEKRDAILKELDDLLTTLRKENGNDIIIKH